MLSAIVEGVQAVSRGLASKVATVELTEEYLKAAGELARKQPRLPGIGWH